MSYSIENLSLKSLEKIFLVLDDIRYNMEIQNRTKWLNMGDLKGIDGVPMIEHRRIVDSLLRNTDFVKFSPYTPGDCCFDIEVEAFSHFFQKLSEKIRERKGNQIVQQDSSETKLSFDADESILFIEGYAIKIAMRDRKTIAHDILDYIFTDNCENLEDDFYYAEIAYHKFGDEAYKRNPIAWRTYHAACMDIQDKIRKQTANKIEDFLLYNASQRGRVKINPKYLY